MSSATSSGTATPNAKAISTVTPRSSGSLKRKLQVFIEVPRSPFRSPASYKSLKNKRDSPRTSIAGRKIGVPLSAKQLNNGQIGNVPPSAEFMPLAKKPKLSVLHNKSAKVTKQVGKDENEAGEFPNGFYYCHQCARKRDISYGLQCTLMKGSERCQKRYCKACMKNRYAVNVEDIVSRGSPSEADVRAGHVPGLPYVWKCPQCADNCNCSRCRKAKGLEPTGKFTLTETSSVSATSKGSQKKPDVKVSELGSVTTISKQKQIADLTRPDDLKGKGKKADSLPSKAELGSSEKLKHQPKRPKKSVPEPKWNEVPTELTRAQAEDRFFLREFVLRFSPLMSVSAKHQEDLDEFDLLTDAGAKSLIMNLLNLSAADAEASTQKVIRDCHKRISASGFNPSTMWTHLAQLRDNLPPSSGLHIPDPLPPAVSTHRTRAANSVTHSLQLLPILVCLVECAMVGASVREEIERGVQDAKEENRGFYAAVKEENERWAVEREKLLAKKQEDEKKPNYDSKKAAQSYRDAYNKHKITITRLDNEHMLKLHAVAPRFKPLGTDAEGRTYYISTPYEGKSAPSKEERSRMHKWGWFLAVYGKVEKSMTSNGVQKNEEGDDDVSDSNDEGPRERWWGFSSPSEIKKLAAWIAAKEGLDMKNAQEDQEDSGRLSNKSLPMSNTAKGSLTRLSMAKSDNGGDKHTTREIDFLGIGRRPNKSELKALVKALNDYADFLSWRCGGNVDADDDGSKKILTKKVEKGSTA